MSESGRGERRKRKNKYQLSLSLSSKNSPPYQRLQPPEQKPRRVRVNRPSQDIMHRPNSCHGLRSSGDSANKHVVVPGEILCARVKHQIRAQAARPLVDRRRESRVDRNQAPFRFAEGLDSSDVDAAQVRVRRRLREEQRDVVVFEGLLQSSQIARVDHRGSDPHFRQHRLNELPRAAVAVRGGHDVAPGGNQSQEHRRRRVHPARGHQAVLRLLQDSDLLLCRARCGVAVSAIFVGAVPPLLVGDELGGVLEGVGGGLMVLMEGKGRKEVVEVEVEVVSNSSAA